MKICKCGHKKQEHNSGRCSGIKTIIYDPLKHGDIFAKTCPCKCKKFRSIKNIN